MEQSDAFLAKMEMLEQEYQRSQAALTAIMHELSYIDRRDVNYDMIEQWRKKMNRYRGRGETIKRKDFLINAEAVDPFNANAPHHRKLAQWFMEMCERFRDHDEPTIQVRGLHYILQDPSNAIKRVGGKPFENNDACWKELERASKYARYLGLIPFEMVEDRRSIEPIVQDYPKTWYRNLFANSTHPIFAGDCFLDEFSRFPDFPSFPDMPGFPVLPSYYFGMRGQQQYRIEVWAEKTTKDRILRQVCTRNRVTLVMAKGEISITSMWRAVLRAEQYPGITTVILYISDFDPAGQSMPVAAARKLEFIRYFRGSTIPMRLYPILLTYEQCLEHDLPPAPIRETNQRRHAFEFRYKRGGATELDSLEALHKGEMAKILEREIARFHDITLDNRVKMRTREIYKELGELQDEILQNHDLDKYQEEYDRVEKRLEEIKERHDEYLNDFEALAESYRELEARYDQDVREAFNTWHQEEYEIMASELYDAVKQAEFELEEKMPDVKEYEVPEPEIVPVDDGCLYDSSREYVPQLLIYKKFAGKFEHLVEDESEGEE